MAAAGELEDFIIFKFFSLFFSYFLVFNFFLPSFIIGLIKRGRRDIRRVR